MATWQAWKNSPESGRSTASRGCGRWPTRSAFDAFLTGAFDRTRKQDWSPDGPDEPVMFVFDDRVSLEAAERIRARLEEVTQEIAQAEAGDTPVSVAIGFYRRTT